uniref:Transposase (Putative), gypsy type n=1 Tax=Tanacetum cinerariifolium TaxID=118510 RepID=A0A6L2JAP6_TANCI|nr:hypothetical protein [Tanacetum cinerariifolium]
MSFSKRPGKNTPQCYTKPLDSLKNWTNRFFWVDERVFPTVVDWRTSAPKDGMPAESTYSVEAVRALDTHRTPIQKQPKMLLCLVGISRRYYLGDEEAAAPEVPPSKDVPAASAPEAGQAEEVAATDPSTATESRKRGRKSLAAIELGLASTRPVPVPENAPTGVSDPDPLSFADPRSRHPADVAQSSQGTTAAGDSESGNASFASAVGSPKSSFSELRHLHNDDFLRQCNVNLARQVVMGSQLCLRFEQEAKLLRKSVAQVARRDKRIQARELDIKNLEALLEAEADMKKAAEDKSAGLSRELEDMRAPFSDLQAFADVVSAGIAKGMSEGLRHGVEHGHAQLSLESIEAYDPEAKAKYVAALQALKDLNYPLVDQLEGLKDAPMDVIMAAIYLESDNGADAPQHIHDLRPSSSQLTIPVYPELRDLMIPWAYKEEMLLADAIAANISRAEKKKKCRIVCRTHGVGFAHHARSDGILVSVPTVVP